MKMLISPSDDRRHVILEFKDDEDTYKPSSDDRRHVILKFKGYGNIPSPFVMLVAMLFQKFKDDGN